MSKLERRLLQTHFCREKKFYDGHQLSPLYAYLNHKILGPSMVSWIGGCEVKPEQMVDGEDLLAGEKIAGDEMLHFIVELFNVNLVSMVLFQRLFAAQVQQKISQEFHKQLRREGDDLYLGEKKLSISVATRSTNSVLLHFAMNISNQGTPVPTVSLKDLGVNDIKKFAESLMESFSNEYESILTATYKVRSV